MGKVCRKVGGRGGGKGESGGGGGGLVEEERLDGGVWRAWAKFGLKF